MKIVKYLREIRLSQSNKSREATCLDFFKFQIVKQLMEKREILDLLFKQIARGT